jgi:hypothetical protein
MPQEIRFDGDPFASEVASKWQTKLFSFSIYNCKWLIINWLPRMDLNHDKVIQSQSLYSGQHWNLLPTGGLESTLAE